MRELLDRPLDAFTLDDVRAALSAAGDEDDRWEAKGGTLRPEHVFRPVAGARQPRRRPACPRCVAHP